MKKWILFLILIPLQSFALMLVPMDDTQANHLKAYGLAYYALQNGVEVKWLLNYRGGSFVIMSDSSKFATRAVSRNVTYTIIDYGRLTDINSIIERENMYSVRLDKAPTIAVYAPPWNAPWDDAVTLVLEYAEIPYTRIWDKEVMAGLLTTDNFDWLHLHHEDFTGQHGKFWFAFRNEPWYIEKVVLFEEMAEKLGFSSVQENKKAVAVKIREYVENGGFMFAMCSATDTIDVALSTLGIDIVPVEIDGSPMDSDWRERMSFERNFAFEDFTLVTSPYIYEFSDIDIDPMEEKIYYTPFHFKLNEFSAKYDTIPAMLVQNHRNLVKGFLGQTTGFRLRVLKKDITILNTVEGKDWVNYIHGDRGKGTFTFYAGHDPEDYAHRVGDPPTNLDLFPNSPGYRLILNNILFPAAEREERRT